MLVHNNREGLTAADDWLPDRFFDEPIDSGVKQGIKLDRTAFRGVINTYGSLSGLSIPRLEADGKNEVWDGFRH